MVSLFMAWSPVWRFNARINWVGQPGDYANLIPTTPETAPRMSPWAMNVDGRAVISRSQREALAQLARARREGARFIDIGCMQINQKYHGAKFSVTARLRPWRI